MPFTTTLPSGIAISPHLSDVPFRTRADVIAILPDYMQDDAPDPIRDAIADGILLAVTQRASDAADFSATADPAYAVGDALDYVGRTRACVRAPGELDDAYRARMIDGQHTLSPSEAIAKISAIVGVACYYWELPVEGLFARSAQGPSFPLGTVDSTKFSGFTAAQRTSGLTGRVFNPRRYWAARGPSAGPRRPLLVRGGKIGMIGATVIALPSLTPPGVRRRQAATVNVASSPTIDLNGNLVNVQPFAGRAVRAADSSPTHGIRAYAASSATQIILDRIRTVLTNAAWPATFRFFLDPALVPA